MPPDQQNGSKLVKNELSFNGSADNTAGPFLFDIGPSPLILVVRIFRTSQTPLIAVRDRENSSISQDRGDCSAAIDGTGPVAS